MSDFQFDSKVSLGLLKASDHPEGLSFVKDPPNNIPLSLELLQHPGIVEGKNLQKQLDRVFQGGVRLPAIKR